MRKPNLALRELLNRAGWSGAQLAREVNALGAEVGMNLHYNRTAITHWVAGMRPRPPVPQLVAEAFRRKLGTAVTAADTGLAQASSIPPPGELAPAANDVTTCLDVVASAEAELTYALADLAIPPWEGGKLPGRASPPRSRPWTVQRPHVEAAQAMLELFSTHDAAHGSSGIRKPLSRYLHTSVSPWLRQSAPPAVRRSLARVAGQLIYLCAFTHFDDNRQAQAQRYYLAGVRLARESGDVLGFALGLRGLSVQAQALGHFQEAARLASAAAEAGVTVAPPQVKAFLISQAAVTSFEAGYSRRAAVTELAQAREWLERAEGTAAVARYNGASLALHTAALQRRLGDLPAAVAALTTSLRLRPATERRSAALTHADQAELHLQAGQLEQACSSTDAFLRLYPQVHCGRADTRLRGLLATIRPHARHPHIAAVYHQATQAWQERHLGGQRM